MAFSAIGTPVKPSRRGEAARLSMNPSHTMKQTTAHETSNWGKCSRIISLRGEWRQAQPISPTLASIKFKTAQKPISSRSKFSMESKFLKILLLRESLPSPRFQCKTSYIPTKIKERATIMVQEYSSKSSCIRRVIFTRTTVRIRG